MHCQNIRPSAPSSFNRDSLLNVVPMNQEDKDKMTSLIDNYSKLSAQMAILTRQLEEANKNSVQVDLKNRLSMALENTTQKLNLLLEQRKQLETQATDQALETERLKKLQAQAHLNRQTVEAKLENAKKLKEESDEQLKIIQQKQAAAIERKNNSSRNVKVGELKKAFKVTEEQVLATLNQAQFDLLKTIRDKKCLGIDKTAMQDVLLPLILKYNLIVANFAVFKDEISEEALVTFFANVPSTQIRSISIAKPLSEVETAAKTQIEALIAQRGGSFKVS